jgi:catechol 2,3-dioxygenase-like lactoylglutathione lyase family enzyme
VWAITKKRSGDPWMPADAYGRSLPAFTINLIVADIPRSVSFYREVLGVEERYSDPDFAAMRLAGLDFMLHADHSYDGHPWHLRLAGGEGRGLGAELRLLGVDPDGVEARARARGDPVLAPATDKGHGWRETWVQDPDGYVWAAGSPLGG